MDTYEYLFKTAIGNQSSLKGLKLKDWYAEKYESDQLIEQIDENATFEDFALDLLDGTPYKHIPSDSIVRERFMEQLAEMLGIGYDVIYHVWLATPPIDNDFLEKAERIVASQFT